MSIIILETEFRVVLIHHDGRLILLQFMSCVQEFRCSYLEKVHLLEIILDWFQLMQIEKKHMLCSICCSKDFAVLLKKRLYKSNRGYLIGNNATFITVEA